MGYPLPHDFRSSASYEWTVTLTDSDLSGITLTKIQANFKPEDPELDAFTVDSDSDTTWVELTSGTAHTFKLKVPLDTTANIPAAGGVYRVQVAAEDATKRWIYPAATYTYHPPETGTFS